MAFLETINSPEDLRRLPREALPHLAREIREFMIDAVSKTGGHLAPSLGTIELTIALHYVYDTPGDRLLWDVGHQAYAHKILTGRRERFTTLRQHEGISGFPRVGESEYDAVSAGHASTSISAALGMALGRDLLKQAHAVVAVIGDGSLGGGLAFEGRNHLGSSKTNLTVVLNDNEMSISRNVGALAHYLTHLITDKRYYKIKSDIWDLIGNMPKLGKSIQTMVHNVDESLKHLLVPGKMFQDMGLRYLGPIDGHNITELVEVFSAVRGYSKEPTLVHVLTQKGKGYSFAEENATKYHGIGSFQRSTGEIIKPTGGRAPTYSEVFGQTLCDIARKHSEIVAITAAMRDGTGLLPFSREFPERFFDVGIAESHAVSFAAGLTLSGLRPVVALYSTFLQRSYDQIIHDVALDRLPVIFCVDRAGLVGEDGPTHHGAFDISFLRSVPGAVIMAPRNGSELRRMLFTAVAHAEGPVFIRYPRGGDGIVDAASQEVLPVGVPEVLREGAACAIIAVGDFLKRAEAVAGKLAEKGISPTVVDARFVKPLDEASYRRLLANHTHIVTLENNTVRGGFGSGLMEFAVEHGISPMPRFLTLGLPDEFVPHGDNERLLASLGLDVFSISEKISAFLS